MFFENTYFILFHHVLDETKCVCPIQSVMINSNSFFGTASLNILVTNDDGIYADGLWRVAEELRSVGEVTIVAPDRDQSGAGASVSLRLPIRYREIKPLVNGITCYAVEGTPSDSVIIAIRKAVINSIDLVVSGINDGANLGNDVFISGTVGAALQGYAYGIPSIAISVAGFSDVKYDVAAKTARYLADLYKNGILTDNMMLNVNVPKLPLDKIQGVEITSLGERSYTDRIDEGHDGKRDYYWIIRGIPEWSVVPGTDIWALEQNKISITPYPVNKIKDKTAIANGLKKELMLEI
jgi:5'-nucleotidase